MIIVDENDTTKTVHKKWSRGVQTPFFRGEIFALIKNCVSLICVWERHKKTGPTKKKAKNWGKKASLMKTNGYIYL